MSDKIQETIDKAFTLLITDASGVYIPQRFAESLSQEIWDAQDETVKVSLQYIKDGGPEAEWYWDEWEAVTNNYKRVDGENVYALSQNGDLWEINTTELDKLDQDELDELWNRMS